MPTLRQETCLLIETAAEQRKLAIQRVWNIVYDGFERSTNHAFRRLAYNAGETVLDMIEQEGYLSQLHAYIQGYFGIQPASPDTKKAPLPGSLFNEGDNT